MSSSFREFFHAAPVEFFPAWGNPSAVMPLMTVARAPKTSQYRRDFRKVILALAENSSYRNQSGLYCPSAQPSQSGPGLFPTYSARMVEVIQTIAAGTLFALPSSLDLISIRLWKKAFQTDWKGWS